MYFIFMTMKYAYYTYIQLYRSQRKIVVSTPAFSNPWQHLPGCFAKRMMMKISDTPLCTHSFFCNAIIGYVYHFEKKLLHSLCNVLINQLTLIFRSCKLNTVVCHFYLCMQKAKRKFMRWRVCGGISLVLLDKWISLKSRISCHPLKILVYIKLKI